MFVFLVNGNSESVERREEEKKDTTLTEVSQQRNNEESQITQQEKQSSPVGDKKAPHTFGMCGIFTTIGDRVILSVLLLD